jgi:hypothetical protein
MSEKESKEEACGAKTECFCLGTGPQLFEMLRKIGPDSARTHFRNARIEFLKGMRELLDARIEGLSRQEQKGTTVTVE